MATASTGAKTGNILQQAISSVRRMLGPNLSTAASLQFRAWWQGNNRFVYGFLGLFVVYLLWKLLFKVASMFINLTESMAEYGFMGLALTIVVLSFLYVRRYFGVSAPTVYRNALVRLNMSPAVLEVMGAPLAGSPVRAYVVTGGGLYFSKTFRPKIRPRRIQMIFPLSGKERKGLVSLEAKKKQGRYVWKLLAVDLRPEDASAIALTSGNMHANIASKDVSVGNNHPERIYVDGDLAIYQRGGVLSELRDPFLRALSLQPAYEREDEAEDELEELQYKESQAAKRAAADEAKHEAKQQEAEAVAAAQAEATMAVAEASAQAAGQAEASAAAAEAAADAEAAAAAEAQAAASGKLQAAADAHAARVAAIAQREEAAAQERASAEAAVAQERASAEASAAAALAVEEAAAHLAVAAPPPPDIVVVTPLPVEVEGSGQADSAGAARVMMRKEQLGEWVHKPPTEADADQLAAAVAAAEREGGETQEAAAKKQTAWSRWFSGPK